MSNTINPDSLMIQMRAMAAQAQGKSAVAGEDPQRAEFSDLLKQTIDKVNDTQTEKNRLTAAFQQGDPNVQMSEVMLSMQKAKISFQAMVEVRNKLVQAYQDVWNMPV